MKNTEWTDADITNRALTVAAQLDMIEVRDDTIDECCKAVCGTCKVENEYGAPETHAWACRHIRDHFASEAGEQQNGEQK